MQTCKSCFKEIESGALKCSYCQAYQLWYKHPQFYSLIMMLPFFIFIFWNTGLMSNKEFSDFESEFSFTQEKIIDAKSKNRLLITYKVKNDTEYQWDNIRYEIISRNNGELLASESDNNYFWVIRPNSESFLTVNIQIVPNANEWELKIKDLEVSRF
ncbi:hypothetical protein CW748_16685 [Alteromonadales bacterium alter-6D02]|nr:hypothetical protein CW748_16685 [Alteromonadales bacterium alter-6D02]